MGDIDALGAPQGRAIDLGLRLAYDLDRHWQVSGGYRMLDGGVDNRSVFNFAQFHSLTAGVAYRF
jgi:opacity protein-like surface antigen